MINTKELISRQANYVPKSLPLPADVPLAADDDVSPDDYRMPTSVEA